MDMGVGSFVFSQGIVSAIPVIQLINSPADLRPPLPLEILSVLERSLPVLVLGLLRVVLVKGTQYPVSCPKFCFLFELLTRMQEHVTEYGVHWNFFLTLALIPILRVLLHPLITNMPISLLGLIVASGT
jgi:glucosaminylphosphatidylinositol acyltransferase